MSFTNLVKNEITKFELSKTESISFLSAYINIAGIINDNKIKIITENAAIARSLFKIIKNTYQITPIIRITKPANFHKHHLFTLEIYDMNNFLSKDLALINNRTRVHLPADYLIADESELRAYLMGLFLAKGSVNDPKTARYHLEIIFENKKLAEVSKKFLQTFNLNSKIIKRQSHYVLYLKEAEKISDFLRVVHAYNSVLYYEDIRIYRDHKNMTNRLNNCEQANIDKMINSSNDLLRSIEIIKNFDQFDLLSDKLKETIDYKLKYPETSLSELSYIISKETGKKISRSGLNHRFREIKSLAQELEK